MTNILADQELLRRLVGFDSTSRNSNLPIADFIADYLDRPGIRIERQIGTTDDKVNLIVTMGPDVDPQTRAGLLLSGHMDVVPADEPEWKGDPFVLRETDEAYFGRGACDMKGFVALAINTLVRTDPSSLSQPLALLLSYDEELGILGAGHFARTWPKDRPLPRQTVIGEPTSLRAVRLHKGHAGLTLQVRGRSCHSGYPHLGHNAIEPAARAITALETFRREVEKEGGPNSEHFPEVPYVALNLAMINAGTAVNIVPDLCTVRLGFRLLPGMESGPFVERIRECVAGVLEGEDWELELVSEAPPLLLEESAPIYRAVCGLVDQAETLSASYATDASWLQTTGLDCVVWGPGSIEVAHQPNEWMPKDEFHRTAPFLDHLVNDFCRS